jgi:hypothetical protein
MWQQAADMSSMPVPAWPPQPVVPTLTHTTDNSNNNREDTNNKLLLYHPDLGQDNTAADPLQEIIMINIRAIKRQPPCGLLDLITGWYT